MHAYRQGAFPMADSREADELVMVRPHIRGVIPLDSFHVPARLARTVRTTELEVRVNADFPQVIAGCAALIRDRWDTWINRRIEEAYTRLHEQGHAHSVECWAGHTLVGGLYGVQIGAAFFGESMFTRQRDASKIALVHLVARLNRASFRLLDAQFVNAHLKQFNILDVPHGLYMRALRPALEQAPDMEAFRAAMTGEQAVAYARQSTSQAS
ncbi:leucyl/phenylalanyl-tRNA--protein transferase [Brevundimonas sp.]|uniref:leucyl/phenylalanyl-tRNA--protein transferase n=1 Tax=Brevundimonas sp. TaxID=1871086 RepID=UPI0025BB16EC|nr:leucyl/phenylalanyl-tRNA--protein transferase [Brevundimonas sp.]